MPVAGIVTAAGQLGTMNARQDANDKLSELLKIDPKYKENPLAAQRLGLAQTLFNARMPGAASIERNIYANQANTTAKFQRGATDASQLLSGVAAIQGQTNDAFSDLGIEELRDYQRRFGNLTGAQEGLINEQDKVFQDRVRRFGNRAQIQGAQAQNQAATWQELSNIGMSSANFITSMMGIPGGLGIGGGAKPTQPQRF